MRVGVARALGLLLTCLAGPACAGPCSDLLPKPKADDREGKRLVGIADLVALRDIGPVGVGRPDVPILAVSPDGTKVAFQVRRADAKRNAYCIGIAISSIDGRTPPFLVDQGGDFLKAKTGGEGYVPREAGFAEAIRPVWAKDGKSIYYLRRDDDETRVWHAFLNGKPAVGITPPVYDVEAFDLAADGAVLFRPAQSTNGAHAQEARTGYLIDDRFNPAVSLKPWARDREPAPVLRVTASGDGLRTATADDIKETLFAQPQKPALPPGRAVIFSSERWVRAEAENPGNLTAPKRLIANIDGEEIRCGQCDWAYGLWWSANGQHVYYFQKRPGSIGLSLFRWTPETGNVLRLTDSEDYWIGCQPVSDQLICARENALTPRHLVSIDLSDGRIRAIFDPNPEFAELMMGPVRAMAWTNAFGIETVAQLVLPPGRKANERLPLVVVGYDARGFLRGGTGDEYPIQAFAAHGFAVLVYSRPPLYGAAMGSATPFEVTQRGHENWNDYRNVLSSVEVAVDRLIKEGIVDPARVGLTGFSNGASVAQFAMINSEKFQVFALSHCCEDPVASLSTTGFVANRWLRRIGYPAVTDTAGVGRWQDMSIRLNASHLNWPVLMQLSDDEYLGAIEGLTALKELDKPVEAYVFEDEHHVKWQPAHRAALYERSLDWFRFWLKGEEEPTPSKTAMYERWHALRPKEGGP